MFPTFGIPNIKKLYIFTIFNSPYFMIGNWTFFFLKYMTYGELGYFDAIAFAIGVFMEIPSGAIADMFGKKKTLILSRLLVCLSFFITAFGGDKYIIFLGTTLFSVGAAFYSGAAEALTYDSMKEKGQEKHYDVVAGKLLFISTVTTIVSALAGGLLFTLDIRFPFAFAGASIAIALLISLFLKEPSVDTETFSWKACRRQMKTGFYELFQTSLRPFLPPLLVLGIVFYMFDTGFLRLAMGQYFGYNGEQMSYITAVLSIIGAFILYSFDRIRAFFGDTKGLGWLLFFLAVSFFASTLPIGLFGIIPLIVMTIIGLLATPWTSVIVNKEIESRYRATTLSAFALLIKLPYPLLAVSSGYIMQFDLLQWFLLVFGFTTAGVWLYTRKSILSRRIR